MTSYAELATTTNFSFLRGASHPEDLVVRAVLLGYTGIGIADCNTLAGVVRAYGALQDLRRDGLPAPQKVREGSSPGEYAWIEDAKSGDWADIPEAVKARAKSFKLLVGVRLVFIDGTPDIIAYPENRTGWARLCRLLTQGKLQAKKGECNLRREDLLSDCAGLLLIVIPPPALDGLETHLHAVAKAAPGNVWLGAALHLKGDDRHVLHRLSGVAASTNVPLIAVNDVLYDTPEQRPVQDILTCIREGLRIEMAGTRLEANAERHLKPPADMAQLFRDCPSAIAATQDLLQRVSFSLGDLKYEYPDEPVPSGWTSQGWLDHLTWKKAHVRYPDGVPDKVRQQLEDELKLITQLDYAPYFLTVYDVVRYAKEKGILCQGRGSAANSAVCYVLGITSVDPEQHNLLFARFISNERREPPDIDVDFEHQRREEVIQYIYKRYGRERAGLVATVIRYRPRSAIREVGKALGLSEDITSRIAGTVWGSGGSKLSEAHLRQAGIDHRNPVISQAIAFATRILGFPRHLSQHVGGFVLARGRLDEIVPIGNAAMDKRTFIEWDKDDIDVLRLMKVDVLALGMLTCIRKAFDLIRTHEGENFDLAALPAEQQDVYEMLQKGDSIGVFQVESRAQINMLPRLKPKEFYDLVIQVAIVRPGPIQGDMVHPYLRRRKNRQEVTFPHPNPPHDPNELHNVLSRTLGVPLFQEQAMQLAMVAAKFTDAEANQLRRAMATFRNAGTIHKFESMLVERMVERGYDRDFAQRCFEQIKGFGEYGFPESHAAAFARLVYISAFIKRRYPAAFACALLNSQPMGFYAPAQIVRDARDHGVDVYPIDVNASDWDNTLCAGADGRTALRLGFRQIDGLSETWCKRLIDLRRNGYADLDSLARRTRLPQRALRLLADADCFRSVGIHRRDALWAARRLPEADKLPLFAAAREPDLGEEPDAQLSPMSLGENIAVDYQTTRLSLKGHPMEWLRAIFRSEGIASCAELTTQCDGSRGRVAGVVLVRQRPGKGNAIFITLEDETGITNAVLWMRTFEKFRKEVMGGRLLLIEGKVQRSPENVIHLMAARIIDRTAELARLSDTHKPTIELSSADEFLHPQASRTHHPRNVRILPGSRDFH
ncbi:DNA polymerase III subunit alpha [Hyphomicrobium denitrificans 1NES1]|uniref:Error-prone DNA polymerase n=1 Tax=Hyphomicrobium denitrificans 1NES1 TaxID=670307 RepID=N0BDT3_9HYPH|nr:error-prone DNA polymerase [Hyphomicrobium denitrificans]AGK58656.1 DNA polymerase III subunit alpha [Hyphomicrobium denitrificans 1NES1]